ARGVGVQRRVTGSGVGAAGGVGEERFGAGGRIAAPRSVELECPVAAGRIQVAGGVGGESARAGRYVVRAGHCRVSREPEKRVLVCVRAEGKQVASNTEAAA